ncbi:MULTISPECIES: TIGR02234 family membrane protein [Gordonia]|jgi:uncharacterized membrane protein (TIGR02234 family)|uniref:TIGR02234 family membrane protein n=1 Tax=Gordonia malaquae NBRC 108250 TaxID=1223542 RepID=M3UTB3_GORML|nr:TIGR02234 family membrane protein [Gordonia malaquae]GAC78572.1 hypothetical protein GM1_004_00170 [Gordonia malaquae NBRC 108250]SED53446.1 trp region conserved hypothetical membrane protein [Gordonia malaquae]
MSDDTTDHPKPNRRLQGIASLLLIAAAGALWGSSRMKWAEVLGADGLSLPRVFEVLGSDWSPWLTGVAALFGAGVIAQFAVRGWALRVVAVIIAVAGVLSAVPAFTLIRDGADDLYASTRIDIPGRYKIEAVTVSTSPGYLLLAGALCAVIAAVLMMRGASARGMSSKYTSPAARQEELEKKVFAERERRLAAEGNVDTPGAADGNERLMWDSLDSGVDPTDD